MEYGYPIVHTRRGKHEESARRYIQYSEHLLDPISGLVDIGKYHGRYIEYHPDGSMRFYKLYQHHKLVGMEYEFFNNDTNSNNLRQVISHEHDTTISMEYFASGNLRVYKSDEYSESYSNVGFITYRTWQEDNLTYEIEYSTGRPRKMTIYNLTDRLAWVFVWHQGRLIEVSHYLMADWSTAIAGTPQGLCLKYNNRSKCHHLSFYDENENVTSEVIGMCMDPFDITTSEETFMTLYFTQEFRVSLPDFIKDEVSKLVQQNKVILNVTK